MFRFSNRRKTKRKLSEDNNESKKVKKGSKKSFEDRSKEQAKKSTAYKKKAKKEIQVESKLILLVLSIRDKHRSTRKSLACFISCRENSSRESGSWRNLQQQWVKITIDW